MLLLSCQPSWFFGFGRGGHSVSMAWSFADSCGLPLGLQRKSPYLGSAILALGLQHEPLTVPGFCQPALGLQHEALYLGSASLALGLQHEPLWLGSATLALGLQNEPLTIPGLC